MEELSLSQLSILPDAEIAEAFDESWRDVEQSVLMHGPAGYRRVSKWLDIEPKASAMAFLAGRPAGVVLTGIREPDRAYIASLAVKAEHRGKGIGRRLLRWGISRSRMFGCRKVGLHVFESNVNALSLYSSAGFRPVRRVGHWEGMIASKGAKGLSIRCSEAEGVSDGLCEEDVAKLWENEPKSLINLGDGLICARAEKGGAPVGYMAYSTRSLCWVLDMGFVRGTASEEAAELLLSIPTARFLPCVMTTVVEGSENERIASQIGLKLERSRIEMELMLSSDPTA